MLKITVDGNTCSMPEGSTILDAAKKLDIDIPTLCHMRLDGMNIESHAASCRICVVEVEGRRNLAPACATPIADGMVVHTNTFRVLDARRTVLELMLSNHPKDCLTCGKSGNCDLQRLADKFSIRESPFYDGEQSHFRKDTSVSVIRNMDKCLMCRRCETMCNQVQTVGALGASGRGFDATVGPAFHKNLEDTNCVYCGQCTAVCPTGALLEHDNTDLVLDALRDPDKIVVVQTAPAVRAALGEGFGLPAGKTVTGKMAAALRRIGFNHVFDTDFAADLTIMEEGSEVLDRLSRFLKGEKVPLPIMTSCCPAWVKFYEHNFGDQLDLPSTARSPQAMFGAIAKNFLAEKLGIPRDRMVCVSVMPCTAKKFECSRPEFSVDGNRDVDISITTRELIRLIKAFNIDFAGLPDEEFDNPLGESTGAAPIFGVTGGVMEAALRTAYELYTGETLDNVEFQAVRGLHGIKTAVVNIGGVDIRLAIAHGLGNARKLVERIRAGENFHIVEVMACPGGCIGGGGQPYHHGHADVLKLRTKSLYDEDGAKILRKSHENPYIIQLYENYLGKPLGPLSHKLLHTHYVNRG